MLKLGEKIRKRRLQLGLTMVGLVRRIESLGGNTDQGNLSRIEKGKQWPNAETLEYILTALEYSLEEMFSSNPESHESNVEPGPDVIMSKPLRISGEIQGGDSGYLDIQQFPEGYAEGCVMHPVRSPNCYALRVRGDSMSPRIKHREIIVIDPDHHLKEGDEVVVHLCDGRQMVKVFLYERAGEISLGSINDKHPWLTLSETI